MDGEGLLRLDQGFIEATKLEQDLREVLMPSASEGMITTDGSTGDADSVPRK